MNKILVIEDDPNLARIIISYLERDGFTVCSSLRGDTGLDMVFNEKPDLVLLDLNLPGMDGMDVANEIRRETDIPIIMVTARVEETDRLKGFSTGADDYISKPFSPRELVARVKAVLHRSNKLSAAPSHIVIGSLDINHEYHDVKIGEKEIDLTPTEYQLLYAMAANPGRVFSRLQLLETLDKGVFDGYERSIDVHIKNLRGKIEPDPKKPRFIETVFGVGYRFSKEK
jgi:DNA-binding response OmpR family regulator